MSVAVFLDTNILDGLPESLESGELSSLTGMVWRVFVPDVAAREWMHHRITKVVDSLEDAIGASRHLEQYDNTIVSVKKLSPEFARHLEHTLARRLRSAKLRILPPPRATVRDLTRRAASHAPPFADRGRGFKDELVIRSVQRVVGRWNFELCLIVSADKDLSHAAVRERIERMDVRVAVVKSLREAITELEEFITEANRLENAAREKEVIALAQQRWQEIAGRVKADLLKTGISEYLLEDAIPKGILSTVHPVRLLEVTPLSITGASLGRTHPSTGRTLATIRVKTKLNLVVRQMYLLPSLTRVTANGPVGTEFKTEESEGTTTIEMDIPVEATVKIDASGKANDLELVTDRGEYYRMVSEMLDIEGTSAGDLV